MRRLASVVLAVALTVSALALLHTPGDTRGVGAAGLPSPAAGPVLTLLLSPATGTAPLAVNVTASVSGGTAPFQLSLCFGTQPHTSPTIPCTNGTVPNWSGTTAKSFPHVYTSAGSYTAIGVVTDAQGQGSGATVLIVVTSGASLSVFAGAVTSNGTAPFAAEFTATATGGTPPLTLQWAFGDGTFGSGVVGVSVRHVYASVGSFTPTLTVTDAVGHVSRLVLPTITVRSASGPGIDLFGTMASPSEIAAAALVFLAAVGVAFVVVQTWRWARWRREGQQIVDALEEGENDPGARSGPGR